MYPNVEQTGPGLVTAPFSLNLKAFEPEIMLIKLSKLLLFITIKTYYCAFINVQNQINFTTVWSSISLSSSVTTIN